MKQLRTTFILIGIAAVFGGYIYLNERGPAPEEGATVLLKSGPDGPREIRITPHEGDGVELFRVTDKWQVAPVKSGKAGDFLPADATTVKPLADSLTLVQTKSMVDDPGPLKDYGLEQPKYSITVDGQKIILGDKSRADSTLMYAKIGDRIAMLPSTLQDSASKSFRDWRDKSVLPVKQDEVVAFSIKSPVVDASFVKNDKKWSITTPISVDADASAIETFLTALSTSQSTSWVDDKGDNLTKWGLDSPKTIVKVGEQILKVGNKLSGGYAAQNTSSSAVFQIPETLYNQINRPLRDWRDKRVANFLVSDVTSVEMTKDGVSKRYAKTADKWQEADGKPDGNVHIAVEDVLYTAAGWSATSFVDKPGADSNYGFDRPLVKLRIATATDNYNLLIAEKDKRVFARSGDGVVMELGPETMSSFKNSLKDLFPAKKK